MLRSNKKWESYIFGLIKKLSFYCNLFWGMVMPCKRQELLPTRFNVKTTVYIYMDSKVLAPAVYFAEPVKISLWAIWAEQHALYN